MIETGFFIGCPFERSIKGLRGTVLLRRNHDHAAECVKALRRRGPAPWSTQPAECRWGEVRL